MKSYRIKVVLDSPTDVWYYAQERKLFMWFTFDVSKDRSVIEEKINLKKQGYPMIKEYIYNIPEERIGGQYFDGGKGYIAQ